MFQPLHPAACPARRTVPARASAAPHVPALLALALLVPGAAVAARPQAVAPGADTAAPAADRPEVPASNRAMAARLAQLADSADPATNSYLNRARAARLRAQLDAVRGDGKPHLALHVQLAWELLGAGETEPALAELETSRALVAGGAGRTASKDPEREIMRLQAIAWMRLGEQRNCLARHGPEACLAPLAGGGLHTDREGSERARALLLDLLARDPDDGEIAWLLNICAMTLGEWPEGVPERWRVPESAFASPVPFPRFPNVAGAAGTDVEGLAGGVCLEDFDGDGRMDMLCSSWGLSDPLALLLQDEHGQFHDAAAAWGLQGLVGGLNLVQADYDNDGDADVLVLRGAWFEQGGGFPNSLLRNDGDRFTDVTEQAGLLSFHPTQTAAWFDADGDGWLDLFVGNETGPKEVHPCSFYASNRDGTFRECAADAGVALEGYVKGVVAGDLDDDGRPDLYVSRIDGPNLLLRNEGGPGRGRAPVGFVDVAASAGVTEPVRSFPTWLFDFDGDGRLDLFVSGFRYRSAAAVFDDYRGRPADASAEGAGGRGVRARLYRNLGDMRFEDVSHAAGVDHVLLTMGCNTGDLDNDGRPDFYCSTGEPELSGLYPNRMFLNTGDGRFADVTTAGGFGHLQKGHAVAFGDLDDDGDQDVAVVLGGAYEGDVARNALFENPGFGRRWLTLRLEGRAANRAAIGARVAVRIREGEGEAAIERTVHELVGTGASFGGNSLQAEIGLGAATAIVGLEVRWPGSGLVQHLADVPLDAVVRLVEGAGSVERVPVVPRRLGVGGVR